MDWLWLGALALWGGVGWRLRGGAFTAMTGVRIGTDGARAIFGGAWMAAPCVALDRHAWLLAAALTLALIGEGWGGYMALGHETHAADRRWPYDAILAAIGLGRAGIVHDAAGLLLCGLWLTLLPAAAMAWLAGWHAAGITLVLGLWLLPAYALAYALRLPPLGRFIDDTTVWGEVFTGAVLCPGLFLALGGYHG